MRRRENSTESRPLGLKSSIRRVQEHRAQVRIEEPTRRVELGADLQKVVPARIKAPQVRRARAVCLAPMWAALVILENGLDTIEQLAVRDRMKHEHRDGGAVALVER